MITDHSHQVCNSPYLMVGNYGLSHKYVIDTLLPSYRITLRGIFLVKSTDTKLPNTKIVTALSINSKLISENIVNQAEAFSCNGQY